MPCRAQVVLLGDAFDTRPFRLAWPPGTAIYLVAPLEAHAAAEAVLASQVRRTIDAVWRPCEGNAELLVRMRAVLGLHGPTCALCDAACQEAVSIAEGLAAAAATSTASTTTTTSPSTSAPTSTPAAAAKGRRPARPPGPRAPPGCLLRRVAVDYQASARASWEPRALRALWHPNTRLPASLAMRVLIGPLLTPANLNPGFACLVASPRVAAWPAAAQPAANRSGAPPLLAPLAEAGFRADRLSVWAVQGLSGLDMDVQVSHKRQRTVGQAVDVGSPGREATP
jgi:hypothetical protein